MAAYFFPGIRLRLIIDALTIFGGSGISGTSVTTGASVNS